LNYVDHLSKNGVEGKWETTEKKNYLIDCPECASSRCAISASHGGWHCWACSVGGNFGNLCKRLDIVTVKVKASFTYSFSDRATTWEYLSSRGIDVHTLMKLQLGYETTPASVVFPYIDINDGTLKAVKKKYLEDGGYSFEHAGKKPEFYIPDFTRYTEHTEVYVTEGEVDALSLYSLAPCKRCATIISC